MGAIIRIRNNGPLVIEGDFELQDAQQTNFGLGERVNIALCRCGASENKPFCDGSHKKIEFQSLCEARDLDQK